MYARAIARIIVELQKQIRLNCSWISVCGKLKNKMIMITNDITNSTTQKEMIRDDNNERQIHHWPRHNLMH
jgi:subtilase family serine protease